MAEVNIDITGAGGEAGLSLAVGFEFFSQGVEDDVRVPGRWDLFFSICL